MSGVCCWYAPPYLVSEPKSRAHRAMLNCQREAYMLQGPAAGQQEQRSTSCYRVVPLIHRRESIHRALLAAQDESVFFLPRLFEHLALTAA